MPSIVTEVDRILWDEGVPVGIAYEEGYKRGVSFEDASLVHTITDLRNGTNDKSLVYFIYETPGLLEEIKKKYTNVFGSRVGSVQLELRKLMPKIEKG